MWTELLVSAILLLLINASVAAKQRPNIVFILADDVGWNDVGFHGSNQIPTPNIDALFYYGVALNQHYVQPLCTPTRAALLTGRYPSNLGMQGMPLFGSEPRGLPPGKLLSHHLNGLGYTSRIVGKWHLGFYKKELTPTYRGFQSHLGFWNGLTSYYEHIYQDLIPPQSNGDTNPLNPGYFSGQQLNGLDFRRNMEVASDLTGRYTTDVFTEEAVNIIKNHNKSAPLFLYLAHGACHAGNAGQLLEAPNYVINKFSHIIDPNRKTYAAMMWKLDESVGKVTAALAKNRMLDNTIIVFASDNGAPTLPVGVWQNWGSNYPLRGVKGTAFEGGTRGVAAFWCPWLKNSSRVSTQLMHVSDWLPTLYVAAGGKIEDLQSVQLDGVDQWSTLINDTPSPRTEIPVMLNDLVGVFSVRKNNWKLITGNNLTGGTLDGYPGDSGLEPNNPPYSASDVLRSTAGVALASVGSAPRSVKLLQLRKRATVTCPKLSDVVPCNMGPNKPCLFDLSTDPCETNNLADKQPDETQALLDLLTSYMQKLVPQSNRTYNVQEANPARFGNVWTPWSS